MKYLKLNTSAKMPSIGLGTWATSAGEIYQAVRWALKLGYTHFDCADVYGNQAEIGQALHDAMIEDKILREDLFIASTSWQNVSDVAAASDMLNRILSDLGLDYLDLWLVHKPVDNLPNASVSDMSSADTGFLQNNAFQTLWAYMEKAYTEGRVKALGVSDFSQADLQNLTEKAAVMPAVNQIECYPYRPENELIDFCAKNQIAVVAYAPLGSSAEARVLEDPLIQNMAKRLNITPAQTILSWQLNRGVGILVKTVHEAYLRENMAATAIELDSADMAQIASLAQSSADMAHKPYVGQSGKTGETVFGS